MRKLILLLVLGGVAFIFGTVPASATTTPVTIIFNDTTDVLSVTTSGSGTTPCGSIVNFIPSSILETCTVTIPVPPGYSAFTTNFPNLYFIGEATGANAKVSDMLVYLAVYDSTHKLTSVMLTFSSDGNVGPLVPCPYGVCNNTENGTVQTVGAITWTKTGLPNIVDTIKFQSDVMPEPASLLLFGSGLGIAAVFLRRRRRLVTPAF